MCPPQSIHNFCWKTHIFKLLANIQKFFILIICCKISWSFLLRTMYKFLLKCIPFIDTFSNSLLRLMYVLDPINVLSFKPTLDTNLWRLICKKKTSTLQKRKVYSEIKLKCGENVFNFVIFLIQSLNAGMDDDTLVLLGSQSSP